VSKSDVPDRGDSLSAFVRARRKTGGLTQHELGDLAGVGKRFVVELEQGKPTLRMDKVNQVLGVFGKRLGPVAATRDEAAAGSHEAGTTPPGEKDMTP
jgi:y4mF family transcriptional regulator